MFRITGLPRAPFEPLFGLADAALAERGIERHRVTLPHAAPCRITLDDAEPGETVLLTSYLHQPAHTPYRQAGPIFVREAATAAFDAADTIPPAIGRRLVSLRGYDEAGAMVEAEVVQGEALAALIERFWANPRVAYAHAHFARRGCFAALVSRA